MAVIRNLVVKISADISSLSKGLKQASDNLSKVSQSFTKVGSSLTAKVTAPLVALGTAAVKTSSQFEQSMANAASVAGATTEELAKMTSIAREMGSKTVFSASDAADALYYMASAGYKVDQMADSIEATLNLASATQYGLAETTDVVIATLNQFGLEASSAERVTNVFASAIGNSMASMDKLSNSMGYVGPVANSLGYDIEHVTGILSVLYNSGYDGSTAGTTLRQAFVSLMNPTSSALKVFEELGLVYENLNPATNDFADIIDRLGQAGMDTSQAMEVFGARGGPGMLAMMSQGGDAIRSMTESITGTNKATEMAATQINTLTGQWKILKSELEEIAIAFGDVLIPMIRSFISKYISPLTKKLMSLSNEQRTQIVNIALIAAAIGPAILAIGKVIGGVSKLLKIIPALFSKVGLIIGVIAVVAAALVHLYKTNEDFRNKTNKLVDTIKDKILNVVNDIKKWWNKNGEAIVNSVANALEFVADIVLEVFSVIYDCVKSTLPVIQKIITDVFGIIKDLWNSDGEGLKSAIIKAVTTIGNVIRKVTEEINSVIQKVWPYIKMIIVDTIQGIRNVIEKDGGAIKNEIQNIVNTIKTCIGSFISVLKRAFQNLLDNIKPCWENIKSMFGELWECIKELYETLKPILQVIGVILMTLFSIITGVIEGTIDQISPLTQSITYAAKTIIAIIRAVCALLRGDWSDAWEYIKEAGVNVWESLKNFGLSFYEFFKGFCAGFASAFGSVKDKIVELLGSVWDAIKTWWDKLTSGVSTAATYLWDVVCNLFNKIKDFFANIIADAFNWGKNLINNIADGIKNAWNKVVDGVKSVGQSIKDFLGFGSPTKKGPGHTADEWIPNLLSMMEQGLYAGIPDIRAAVGSIASELNVTGSINKQTVGEGSSPFNDLLNGYLATQTITQAPQSDGDIVLQIDGQTFAKLIAPKLTKEYKRNGIKLREV